MAVTEYFLWSLRARHYDYLYHETFTTEFVANGNLLLEFKVFIEINCVYKTQKLINSEQLLFLFGLHIFMVIAYCQVNYYTLNV